MHHDPTLRIFDLRPAAEFEQLHIPGARTSTLHELANASLPAGATIVLYSEGGVHAGQAWVLLRARGYRQVLFLREGIYEWQSRVLEPRQADDATAAERAEFARAAELSRYFGGNPRSGVPRAEVPLGYWTNVPAAAPRAPKIRRRGC
jgi:rhodanese-related sulfurtransferase